MGGILDESGLGEREFQWIRRLVLEHSGIALGETKKAMVYRRLSGRLRALHLQSFGAYVARLQSDTDERDLCINAISTNLTYFFREPHHFEFLSELLNSLPRQRGIRIWSAGCATGEEPYSIAMIAAEAGLLDQVTIEASDINTEALEVARAGAYPTEGLNGVSPTRLKRWFLKGKGPNLGWVKVREEVRRAVRFRRLNLQSDSLLEGPFDVIFCRNVAIYFERVAQLRLFESFATRLDRRGYLLIGHSESLLGMTELYRSCGRCIYQRQAKARG